MEWAKLLSTEKLSSEPPEPDSFKEYPINAFEKDYSRIVSKETLLRQQKTDSLKKTQKLQLEHVQSSNLKGKLLSDSISGASDGSSTPQHNTPLSFFRIPK